MKAISDDIIEKGWETYSSGKSLKYLEKTTGVTASAWATRFRKKGLKLRPSGFQWKNCKGVVGKDLERGAYLWFFTNAYKRRAKRKNIEITLTDDEFLSLVKGSCAYCGVSYLEETRRVHKHLLPMLSIDRVNSSKGYTKENCVTACKTCNFMKIDQSVEVWFQQMIKILTYRKVLLDKKIVS